MPLTFPSHAALVIPLRGLGRGRLVGSALVVGSCAPDFSYLLNVNPSRVHSGAGILAFCLPVGLVAWMIYERWVAPSLSRTLPDWRGLQLSRWTQARPLPTSAGALAWILVSLALGAATHVLWDGLTHPHEWPAEALYGPATVSLLGRRVHVTTLLQHGSSLLGASAVLAFVRKATPGLAEAPRTDPGRFGLLAAPAALLATAAVAAHLHRVIGRGALPSLGDCWAAHWALIGWGARGGLFGLLLGCALERGCRSRRASAQPQA